MKLRHGILIGCLSVLLGMGAFAGASSANNKIRMTRADDVVDNQPATKLLTVDQRGYTMTTVHIFGFNYKSDSTHTYNKSDLEYYFESVFGERYTSDWTYGVNSETAVTRWTYHDENAVNGDYRIINTTSFGSSPQNTIILPWWVESFQAQVTNGSDWGVAVYSNSLYNEGNDGYLNTITLYYNNQGGTWAGSDEEDFSADFEAYNITKLQINDVGDDLGTFGDQEHRSKFDYYYPFESPSIHGYNFDNYYTDPECTEEFVAQKLTSNITLYARFVPLWSTIANNKVRLWVTYYNSCKQDGSTYFDSADVFIKLWIHKGKDELVYDNYTTVYNHNDGGNAVRYDYFDVDLSVYTNSWTLTIQRFNPYNHDYWWGATNDLVLSSDNVGKIYSIKVNGSNEWYITPEAVYAGAGTSYVDTELAVLAITGLHTCSPNEFNGYKAFANYVSTFVKNGNVNVLNTSYYGVLDDYYLYDFEKGDTSYSGSVTKMTNAQSKYDWLDYELNGGDEPSVGLLESAVKSSGGDNIAVVFCSLLTVASAAAGFLLLKKKKEI